VLVQVFTFYFLWRFDDFIRVIHDHLPSAYRARIAHLARTIDTATASFFRGRLIVCLIIGLLTGVGWAIVGVPYSAPLGVLAGVLNLVPFMSLLALPPALFFRFLAATQIDEAWATPVTLTMAVYMGVQALDNFLLTPAIGGRSSGLHPLMTVVVLLIGAQLGGLLGALLAIPVASTLGTLAAEWLLPEVRRLARQPASDEGASPGAT
jgi:predicted PurR-regulated permease PerM